MKIAFDSWVLSSRLRHQGTYVYAQNLLAEFKKLARHDPGISFCLFRSPRAGNDANDIPAGQGFALAESRWLGYDRLWRLGGVNLAARRQNAALLFSPTSNIVPAGPVPVVCTIHDATPVVMPAHSRAVTLAQRSLLRCAATNSRAVITVSECSRRDLIETCGIPEEKVTVVYNVYDDGLFNDRPADRGRLAALRRRFGLERPYLWHHGVIQPRKNLLRLIDAYRLLLSRNLNLDFDLVLAGPLGWAYAEIVEAAADGAGQRGRVILTGALEHAELAALLKGATLAVAPSLYEGFCLPMVEAMASGVAVVASDASCLPEVSGGVLRYFDPRSIDAMASCMESVLDHEPSLRGLAQRGHRRAAAFSWQRCAGETLSVLKNHARATEGGTS